MAVPKYLGLHNNDGRIWTSYYIGACNLPGKLPSLVVLPKYENLDFMAMLSECVSFIPSAEYFGKCYGIESSGEKIECAESYDLLSPLLAMHYIFILNKLVDKGLTRSYINRKENLRSKVKGRIEHVQDWRKNYLFARRDRVYCQYSEFSEDSPINRILKKAFLIASNFLKGIASKSACSHTFDLNLCQNNIKNAFMGVGSQVSVHHSVPRRGNKLNTYYPEVLPLAKEIILHKENCITKRNYQKKFVRPFWIDMSRLFEVYVLAKLQKKYGTNIEFQVAGYHACADYINRTEHQIIDAKYKSIYLNNTYEINDIREISGYARDRKICKRFLNYQDEEPVCIIIYPDDNGVKDFGEKILLSASTKIIPQFKKFYKIGISLPTKKVHSKI